ncbi:MAG TPA: HAMP domain-containing sensor histidine kinase, partial [Chryseosolibacter sp.]|nr:HAMP domain-containing sensor histidine kinase [Chryseosolibacter sp.]
RVKSTFLSNVRNEINNPLTAILGLSASMKDADNVDLDKLRRWAKVIQNEVFDLNFLITNIFIAAEIEAGIIVPQTTDIDIHALVADQVNLLKRKAQDLEVEIVFENTQVKNFKTDYQLLERILANLIYEGVQCCERGRRIILQVYIHNNRLIFTMEYTGSEIQASSEIDIFDRLRQHNDSLANPGGNCGLTLAVAKDLTDRLNGTIRTESTTNNFQRTSLNIPELATVIPNHFFFDDQNMPFGQEDIL